MTIINTFSKAQMAQFTDNYSKAINELHFVKMARQIVDEAPEDQKEAIANEWAKKIANLLTGALVGGAMARAGVKPPKDLFKQIANTKPTPAARVI